MWRVWPPSEWTICSPFSSGVVSTSTFLLVLVLGSMRSLTVNQTRRFLALKVIIRMTPEHWGELQSRLISICGTFGFTMSEIIHIAHSRSIVDIESWSETGTSTSKKIWFIPGAESPTLGTFSHSCCTFASYVEIRTEVLRSWVNLMENESDD